ncbi:MAG: leucine-rich repeat domain-containing protein [Pseudomonadota bacterium]
MPQAEDPGVDAAPPPRVRNPTPAILRNPQRSSRVLAGCFGISKPVSPTTIAECGIETERFTELDAAIDQWRMTQNHAVGAADKIKKVLRETNSSRLFGNARAPKKLVLQAYWVTSIPIEICQARALETLDLTRNKLTNLPAQVAHLSRLKQLILRGNSLTNFPVEMAQVSTLWKLDLSYNYLNSFPTEMWQAKALRSLDLSQNQLTSLPAEMGQATKLRDLALKGNRLNDLPAEIANLSNLRHLDLSSNRFETVPRALLRLPGTTEIDLRKNPLPEQEILLVREAVVARRNAGFTPPQILLPPLAGEANEFRDAVANNMNVHTTVLTTAFKKRLDEVARQFPKHLTGDVAAQHAELKAIEARLTYALRAHAKHDAPNSRVLRHARKTASIMFKKGNGERPIYFNEFKYSPGHVLAYTFLSLEAQWAQTPESDLAQARRNGMQALVAALDSGSGMCDTRLSEEVMQLIGLPLSDYAQANPDVFGIKPPKITEVEAHDLVMIEAKRVLGELIARNKDLGNTSQPVAWRQTLVERIETEHPKLPRESLEKTISQIQSMWETFYDLVEEQRANANP